MTPGSEGPALVARVLPNVTGIDKQFDYLVPDTLRGQVRVGTMVRVPLANRRIGGWVVALAASDDTAAAIALDRLKPIAKVTGEGPAPEVVALARWAAHRWAGRVRPILASASPASCRPIRPAGRISA